MDLTQLATQHLPVRRKMSANGGIYICCPLCVDMGELRNDTKFRGGFTTKPDGSFIYHCHNCGFATGWEKDSRVSKNLMKFLNKLGIKSSDIPLSLRLLKVNEKIKVEFKKNQHDIVTDFKSVPLPDGAHSFDYWCESDDVPELFLQGFEYLASRGEPVFNNWKYYWSNNPRYGMNQRIIIPFYNENQIVGYTCRRFTDDERLNRYYSIKQEDYMFNQELVEQDLSYLIIVEGVFDAISINGIGTLKNDLSQKQINLLNLYKDKIIIVPDRDKAGYKLVEHAIENEWMVSIPRWDNNIKDCADATNKYGRLYTIESIIQNKMTDRMKIISRFNAARAA